MTGNDEPAWALFRFPNGGEKPVNGYVTSNERTTSSAGYQGFGAAGSIEYASRQACEAVIVHVPGPVMRTTSPATLHQPAAAKATVRPELAVAEARA